MNDVITLSLPRPLVQGLGTLLILLVLSALVYISLPEKKRDSNPLSQLHDHLGLQSIPLIVFMVVLALWTGLAITLTIGLFGLISEIIYDAQPETYLFYVLRIAGLTTVLGAVIALPFTMIRLGLSQKQTKTAEEGLFNEKINAATLGLYARRQITKAVAPGGSYKHHQDFWQDDIVQRAAAIDRLEGLADENRDDVPRIARLLSVYVRELSDEVPAVTPPGDLKPKEMRDWANKLPKLRSDMEKAAQTLGRLNLLAGKPLANGEIDLRGANLQSADLQNAMLPKAYLSEARLQGAYLPGALLQGAFLQSVHLQGAYLQRAQLQGAYLGAALLQGAYLPDAQLGKAQLKQAQLQGADLRGAHLQGANLNRAELQGTNLSGAQLQGADLREAQLQGADLREAQLQGADLREAQLQGADLRRAHLQRANVQHARLQGADLRGAQLQAAHFFEAWLQGANLSGAQLQGAFLGQARLQGADLRGATFDASTILMAATLQGAAFRAADLSAISFLDEGMVEGMDEQFTDIFADASVVLPGGVTVDQSAWPPHCSKEKLGDSDFITQWRAWQKTLPEGWDKDIPKP